MDYFKNNREIKNRYLYYLMQSLNISLSLYLPKLTKNIMDSIMFKNFDRFVYYIKLLIIITILFNITLALSSYIRCLSEEKTLKNYRLKLINYLVYEKRIDIIEKSIGYFLNRYNDDIENLKNYILYVPYKRISSGIIILLIFYMLVKENVSFTILIFSVFPIFFIFQKILSDKMNKINKAIQENKEMNNNNLEELIKYNYTIKSMGAMKKFMELNNCSLNKYFKSVIERSKIENIYDMFLATGLLNFVSIIIYGYGGYLIFNGKITIGTLAMFQLYYSKLWNPLEFYLNLPKINSQFKVSLIRLNDIFKYKMTNDIVNKQKFESLILKGISLSYGDKEILSDINLSIKKGDNILLTGGNGSGKSSLVNIMSGIIQEYSGAVYLNNNNFKELNFAEINSCIKVINAEPEIFYGTVRDNITLYNPEIIIKDNKLIDILKENKIFLNTFIGGTLDNISSGEKKIIQLLRAFYCEADLLLIDEPLNFIDERYKNMIIEEINNLVNDKACVIISHDKAIHNICNRIVEISGGNLNEL